MSSPRARRYPTILSTILFATALTLAIGSNVGSALADTAPRRIETDRTTEGDWAVAGASTHDGYRGMAYVYHLAGRKWVLDATLAPPERGAFARFGGAVAIEGNTLVIGAPWDDGWHGAAFIYERSGNAWRLASRLAPAGSVGDRFGTRVTLADGVVSLLTDGGAVARYRRSESGWIEVDRVPVGAVTFTSGRTVEAEVLRQVEAIDALNGPANPVTALAIGPPRFVRASDATYEDRTEIRWAAVDTSTFFYKIYRRLATDPPSSNVLIRVASQDDSLYSDVTGTPGVVYTYSVTVVDMANDEGPARSDDGSRIIFAPTGFTATDATFENYVQLAWTDRSSVEAGYRILRNGGLLRETAPNTEVIRDSTAVPGTVYSYELIAFDASANVTAPLADNGESAFIGAPLQVSASDGQFTDKVRITWADATALEVNYRVYRSAGGAPTLLVTLPPGSVSYEDLTAVNGTPYEYCVAAVDISNRESARTCDAGGIGVLPGPASVLATDGVFDDKVRITWRDVSTTEDGFHIYRMPAGTADSIMVGNVGAGITTFDDDSGVPGTAYTYCVVASSNEGGRSIPVCDDGVRSVVLAPVSVEATDGTFEDRVDIKWESTATSAVLFKVYRGAAFIRSLGADKRSFSDDGGAAGVRTHYSVRAVTALGAESAASSDTGSRRINTPVSVKASDNEFEDQVAVTWTDRSQIEDGFFVRRRPSGSASPPDRIATRPSNSAAYLDRSGIPGQTYEYFVTAFQAYGPGRADTTESEVGVNAGARALAVPTFVEASDGAFETQIGLSWVDNSRHEEAYHVWRRDLATNDSSRVAVLAPNANRYVDAAVVFGARYLYSVYAADSAGAVELGRSAAGSDTGSTSILPPAAVSASDSYSDRVVVAWIDQSSLESGYRVSRDGVVLGTTAANATSFSDPTAVRNTPYSYCVEAVSGATASASVCDPGRSVLVVVGDLSSAVNFDSRISAGSQAYANENFGRQIAGDGTRLIVGIPSRSGSTYSTGGYGQRAMMFVRVDSQYVVERVFSGGLAANLSLGATLSRGEIGGAVAVHGNSAVVGNTAKRSGPDAAPGYCIDAVNGCAAIYFLERNPTTGAWSWNQTVTDMDGTSSLDMNGDWVVAGGTGVRQSFVGPGAAPEGTGVNASIRIYRRTGSSWTEAQRFNDSSPVAYRYFGSSIALSDSTAIVGAPTAVSSSAVPAAYVFKANPAGVWSQVQSLPQPPFGAFPTSSYGASVGIDGNWAAVGDPEAPGFAEGRVFVYARGNDGSWSYDSMLMPESDGGRFGTSVSVMGDSILVGAPNARSGEGVAYLFARSDGAWVRRKVLSSTGNAATNVGLGTSVEIAPGTLAAGANRTTVPNVAFDAGAVEVRVDKTVRGPATVTASDATYKDRVQVNWSDNFTTETVFRVYRDGALISTLDPNVRNYVDFDAEPGRTYEYCVTAVLPDGAATTASCDFGRRPPDGNITGRIGTVAAAGVSDVQVTLDPAPNRALLLDGSGGVMSVTDGDLFGAAFTVEFWYRGHASGTGAYLLRHATQAFGDAFSVLDPANLTVRVNGVSQATGVSVNDGEWHHVAIDRTAATGALHLYKDGQPAFTGTLATGVTPGTTGPLLAGEGLSGALDDLRVWGRVRTPDEVLSARSAPLTGAEAGLSAYWPLDAYEGAGAEEAVGNRYGRLTAGAHWVGSAAPLEVFAVSDNQGNYVLPKLRYGTSTTFKVIPTVAGHQFTPAFKTITLSTGNPVQNEVGFTDITSYTVSGFVRHQGLSCVAANVSIFVDDQLRGTTDGNGRYAVPVPPGAHRIEPRLSGHTFVPAAITLENVVSDLADQNFIESTERRLRGLVSGGCGIPVGTLTIKIDSEDGCFSRTINASAGFDEVLPPLKFFVRATSVAAAPGGVDPAEVLEFFDNLGAREVDLTAGDQTLDFKYRAPLRVMIEGLPPVTPGCAITVPVIAQMDRHKLTIRVVEDYGTSTCPVDTGTVTVFDEIIDQEKTPVTLVVKNGLAYVSTPNGLRQYETAGNKPNIFAGRVDSEGNDRSYQKSFSVVAEVEGQQSVTKTEWVIVTGSRPRAATFTALSEEIPLYILRDPPGDLSFSSLAKDTSICTKISNTAIVKNSLGFEQKTKVGVDFLLGFIVLTKVRGQLWITTGLEIALEANRSDEFEICAKTTEEFKTSADKLYVGRDGDLYIGVALNLLFAKTDIISIDGCNVVKSEAVTMGVDDVKTIYTFTDFHIRNVVIPQLEDLARLSPSDTLRLNSARRNWESHLALNDSLKAAAAPGENRSFSAGAEYSFSSTVEETKSVDLTMTLTSDAEFSLGFGFDVSATGAEGAYHTKMGLSYARGSSKSTSTSRTTGYTLSDDDIGDFFSVNVKKDLMYGTPVFDLVGGTSSCPWEPWPDPITGAPRTQPLDAPELNVQPPVRNNVPPDSPAVFTLNLTNDSIDLREYQLFAVQESNPGGAVLRLDGDPFSTNGVPFFIDPGQTRQATLTVERGPTQYFYKNLKIVMVPPCEYELFRSGGPLNLTNSVLISVGFQAPCSDITLLRPNPGWSVQSGIDSLELILKDFELAINEVDSLISVGAEYQRSGTDVWTPIGNEIPLSQMSLGVGGKPASINIKWPVAHVPEGTYTVRAFTRCPNGRNYSGPATGVIDRTAPVAFGLPQPADGTMSFGEEISITFNEDIDCATANPANVRLDVIGGLPAQAVESSVTCNGRTLIITPTNPLLAALETGLLRARVENVKDVHGNPMSAPVSWQFNISRQDFAWSPSRLVVAAAFGQEAIARSSLTNGTGANIDFTLENAPAWLTLPAAGGTVGAGETLELAFIVSDTLSLGSRTDTLDAVLSSGPLSGQSIALEIRVDVSCVRPALSVDAADFEHSMTFVSRVQINGVPSADRRDVLAAYVGNQLRGVARPDSISPTQWLYFLTVYGNRLAGETVRFQVWDDDACRLYTATDKAMTFEADKQVGTLSAPYVLASRIPAPGAEQLIPANLGWTWISLNRKSPLGLATNLVLGDLNPSTGDLIKTLGAFSTFDPSFGWQGTLDSLNNANGYMIHLSEAGTIVLNGTPAFPSLTPITVGTGWNWIGYVPQASLSTDAALTGLTARANGDLIKSQYGFAQYNAATQKWIGSLMTMDPGQGYKLYTSGAATTFIYPNPGPNPTLVLSTQRKGKDAALAVAALKRDAGAKGAAAETGPAWEVNPRAYQYNMTITAELRLAAGAPSAEGFQVAAMINGEVRGIAQAEYVDGLGKYVVFLMVYGNAIEGETMSFQVYDPTQGAIRNAAETLAFQPDRIEGTLTTPMALNLGSAPPVEGGPFSLSNAYPNPFKIGTTTRINFSLPVETRVELQIFDVAGRLRRTLVSGIQPAGLHEVTVDAGNLDAGFYYYRLKAGSQVKYAKMTILR